MRSKEFVEFQVKGYQLDPDYRHNLWNEDRWFRAFAYNWNDGCWIVGQEDRETMLAVPDRYGQLVLVDKQYLADWSTHE